MTCRIFDHTADLGLEVTAATGEALFAEAAVALFGLLTDLGTVRAGQSRCLEITGADATDLLINFLRECLYVWNGEGFLVKTCLVEDLTPQSLTALLRGEPFVPGRHRIHREIKAATYHQASVRQTAEGWAARVILDV